MKLPRLLFTLGWSLCTVLFGSATIEDSVVKIYQTRNTYDYESPWSAPYQERTGGSGFVISGNRILTNAHVISDSAFIQVRKPTRIDRYQAEVEWIGHDCDLAVLRVLDEGFFDDLEPLEIAHTIAPVHTEVKVYGYPVGGDDFSVTKGIISRTEVQRYVYGGNSLLCSQIDAPINPGNSGGPVIADGRVVGVAHQSIHGGQNLGYMIPVPIIEHFLKEVSQGKYHGFPKGGVRFQTMENPALRSFYQMEKEDSGVLVIMVQEHSFFDGVLFPGDILLAIDGIPIANDGTIDFEHRKRVSLSHLFSQKYYEDFIDLEILREGEQLTLSVLMQNHQSESSLLGEIEYNKRPTYYIKGGFVFQPLTINYLTSAFESGMPPLDLLYYLSHGKVDAQRPQIILLTRVLPDCVNVGYQSLWDEVILAVNGIKVKNMQELIEAFESCDLPYYRILLESDMEIVLDKDETDLRNPKILSNYSITQDRSENLR